MEQAWWLVFVAFNVCVVIYDLRWRRVPNKLLLAAMALQLLALAAMRTGLVAGPLPGARGWGQALGGFCLGLLFVVPWRLRLMGAGDVKYMAALGLFTGPWTLALAVLWAGVAGGLHALCQVFRMARQGPAGRPRRGVPYAAYIALAALSVALMPSSSPWCSLCSSCCFTGS
ncbi:A24 family peptidase [Bordetella genomosp. 10]|uniref:A24 family peptidase n=1 Tax=Bordetella genomosp. 10 TaxID=1416804 RepID=UPI0015C674AD|nr:A24 family peptidase [Bordetella genomosp. 10]